MDKLNKEKIVFFSTCFRTQKYAAILVFICKKGNGTFISLLFISIIFLSFSIFQFKWMARARITIHINWTLNERERNSVEYCANAEKLENEKLY